MRVKQKIEPEFTFDWGPTLWAAVTMVLIGFAVNFVLFRPGWLVPGALVAGGVAAARSGYYQPSGNNGTVGVTIGTLVLSPLLAYVRVVAGGGGGGDTAFLTVALVLGWVAIIAIAMAPLGYLGATVVDYTRKRVGGPIGYGDHTGL